MTDLLTLPDVKSLDGGFVKNSSRLHLSLIGSIERDDQLDGGNPDGAERHEIENVAGAAQNTVDLTKSSKAVAVKFTNGVNFLNSNVVHRIAPLPKVAREHHNTNAEKVTEEFSNDSKIRFRDASCIETKQSAIIGTQVLQ